MIRPWLIIAALAMAAASWAHGFSTGSARIEARYTAAALAQAQAMAAAQRRTLAAEQSARLLSQALEDEANAIPDDAPACLSGDRVRLLKTYDATP